MGSRRVGPRRLGSRRVGSRRLAAVVVAPLVVLVAVLGLAACSSSRTGHVAIAMDPAGRLLAVLALCDNQKLGALTLTDETTRASATVHPKEAPPFGGTMILTGPIADPRPEGAFDLLDRGHEYTLTGSTTGSDSGDETGTLAAVRFKLDDVVKEQKLRQESVLTANEDENGTTILRKDTFVSLSRAECG